MARLLKSTAAVLAAAVLWWLVGLDRRSSSEFSVESSSLAGQTANSTLERALPLQPQTLPSTQTGISVRHRTLNDPSTVPKATLDLDAPSVVNVGQKFAVNVVANVPDGATTFSFQVHYNPSLLSFVTARQGELVTQNNAFVRLSAVPTSSAGITIISVEQDGGPPMEGKGTVATIEFVALAPSAGTTTRIGMTEVSTTSGGAVAVPVDAPGDAILTIAR